MDSDGDGLISSEKIDITKLSPAILEVLTPLFCELEELGRQVDTPPTLDIEEFTDAIGRLYD
jgi:hypothetical protein